MIEPTQLKKIVTIPENTWIVIGFFIAHGESVKWVKVGSEESTLVAKHIIGVT